MRSMLRRLVTAGRTVEFCDACGSVCEGGCGARARRDRQLERALEAHASWR